MSSVVIVTAFSPITLHLLQQGSFLLPRMNPYDRSTPNEASRESSFNAYPKVHTLGVNRGFSVETSACQRLAALTSCSNRAHLHKCSHVILCPSAWTQAANVRLVCQLVYNNAQADHLDESWWIPTKKTSLLLPKGRMMIWELSTRLQRCPLLTIRSWRFLVAARESRRSWLVWSPAVGEIWMS